MRHYNSGYMSQGEEDRLVTGLKSLTLGDFLPFIDGMIEYLSNHGWTQENHREEDGRVCVEGAVIAMTLTADRRDFAKDEQYCILGNGVMDSLRAVIGTEMGIEPTPGGQDGTYPVFQDFATGKSAIALFNDLPGMTEERVIEKLREAQAKLAGYPADTTYLQLVELLRNEPEMETPVFKEEDFKFLSEIAGVHDVYKENLASEA